jgi:hypothetical protein
LPPVAALGDLQLSAVEAACNVKVISLSDGIETALKLKFEIGELPTAQLVVGEVVLDDGLSGPIRLALGGASTRGDSHGFVDR